MGSSGLYHPRASIDCHSGDEAGGMMRRGLLSSSRRHGGTDGVALSRMCTNNAAGRCVNRQPAVSDLRFQENNGLAMRPQGTGQTRLQWCKRVRHHLYLWQVAESRRQDDRQHGYHLLWRPTSTELRQSRAPASCCSKPVAVSSKADPYK